MIKLTDLFLTEKAKRDYKDEYKKFQSSPQKKKYRAELNKYNRDKGTYGNGDGKDASHKGGKITGFEAESKNRGRAEKSRLKKESAYVGNMGVAELMQFYQMAGPREKSLLDRLINSKKWKQAWELIQKVTGTELKGKQFHEAVSKLQELNEMAKFKKGDKFKNSRVKTMIREELKSIIKEASKKFGVECQECSKKFKTASHDPKCPKCGGYDIDLDYSSSKKIKKEAGYRDGWSTLRTDPGGRQKKIDQIKKKVRSDKISFQQLYNQIRNDDEALRLLSKFPAGKPRLNQLATQYNLTDPQASEMHKRLTGYISKIGKDKSEAVNEGPPNPKRPYGSDSYIFDLVRKAGLERTEKFLKNSQKHQRTYARFKRYRDIFAKVEGQVN